VKIGTGKSKLDGEKIKTARLVGGDWGMGLNDILDQARGFVTKGEGRTEFLILKFDKCKNVEDIADACLDKLDGVLFEKKANLNNCTLNDLAGRVLPVFLHNKKGDNIDDAGRHAPGSGIFSIANMYNEDSSKRAVYNRDFNGIQYFGKGGTSATALTKTAYASNQQKQLALMVDGSHGDPNVMGMMYWTITGVLGNIEKRNTNTLWSTQGEKDLESLFNNGLSTSLNQAMPKGMSSAVKPSNAIVRHFMPNFIMIDFADTHKGEFIRSLNGDKQQAMINELQQKLKQKKPVT
jgi:hypothetical protein